MNLKAFERVYSVKNFNLFIFIFVNFDSVNTKGGKHNWHLHNWYLLLFLFVQIQIAPRNDYFVSHDGGMGRTTKCSAFTIDQVIFIKSGPIHPVHISVQAVDWIKLSPKIGQGPKRVRRLKPVIYTIICYWWYEGS